MKKKNTKNIYTKTDYRGRWIAVHDGESWLVDCKPQNGYYEDCPFRCDELDATGWRVDRSEKAYRKSIEIMDLM